MKTILLIRHSEPIRDRIVPTAMLPLSEGGMKRRGGCSGGMFSHRRRGLHLAVQESPGHCPGAA